MSASGCLSRIPLSELKEVKVEIRRANITATCDSPGLIKRAVEDPEQINNIVHYIRNGKVRNSHILFNHDDVLVNQYQILVSADDDRLEEQKLQKFKDRSTSRSPENKSASSSCDRRSRGVRNKSLDRGNDVRIVEDKGKVNQCRKSGRLSKRSLERRRSLDGHHRRNLDKEKEDSVEKERERRRYVDRPYSRERTKERNKQKSMTPLRPGEYRPNHCDIRRRSRSRDREHPHSKYRSHHCRRSRSLSQKRFQSSEYQKPSTSRKRSRSPEPYSLERSRRGRSLSKYRRERSRSRSPNEYPEGSNSRSSSSRHERYSRRYSRSPGLYDGERGTQKKRSRSSKSPHSPTISHSDHRLSSRSPDYERDSSRSKKYRSRSGSRSPHHHWEPNFTFYEGIPASECWMPPPIRQSFPGMPRFYPPAFYPRIPNAPIIMPPRFPIVAPYPAFRQRLPIYNTRPRLNTPTQSQSTNNNSATTTVEVAGDNKNDNNKIKDKK